MIAIATLCAALAPTSVPSCATSADCNATTFCPTSNNPFMKPAGVCSPRLPENSSCWGFDACMPSLKCEYYGNYASCTKLPSCATSADCDTTTFCPTSNNPFMKPAGVCSPRLPENSSCWGFDACMPGLECEYHGNYASCTKEVAHTKEVAQPRTSCATSADCDTTTFCPTSNNPFMKPAGVCSPRLPENSSCWGFDACMPGFECEYHGNYASCTA